MSMKMGPENGVAMPASVQMTLNKLEESNKMTVKGLERALMQCSVKGPEFSSQHLCQVA